MVGLFRCISFGVLHGQRVDRVHGWFQGLAAKMFVIGSLIANQVAGTVIWALHQAAATMILVSAILSLASWEGPPNPTETGLEERDN